MHTHKRPISSVQFSSITQSCPTLCDPMNRSTPGLPVNHQLPEFTQFTSIEAVMPSSHLILCRPLLLLPSIFPSIRVFSKEPALPIKWPNIGVSAASVLPINTQDWSPLGWTGWTSLQAKKSRESSPAPQFKSISSLALSFVYSSTLTSIHDYWKNHSLD